MLDGISFLKATEQEGIQAMNPFQSPFGGESDTSTKTFISPFYDVLAQWSWKWTLWIKTELAQSEGLPSSVSTYFLLAALGEDITPHFIDTDQ
jgi:hypothetical protein